MFVHVCEYVCVLALVRAMKEVHRPASITARDGKLCTQNVSSVSAGTDA